jgi:transaldolase
MQNYRTLALHNAGHSLWLDGISRELLQSGALKRYIRQLSVTGLAANSWIFERAVTTGTLYDESIRVLAGAGLRGEALIFELALQDLAQAGDLLRSTFERSRGGDGWVSLPVSPLLAHDAAGTVRAAAQLRAQAAFANLLIEIPGTREGLIAAEASIFAGIPVNITFLFSRDQYLDAAQAFIRALERRAAAGLNLGVGSVASVFVGSREAAQSKYKSSPLHKHLDHRGIAEAWRSFESQGELLASARWLKLEAAGALPQRLLWSGTGARDPAASHSLQIVESLPLQNTIDAMSEETLLAFAAHGRVVELSHIDTSPAKGSSAERRRGLKDNALAARLLREGIAALVKSWRDLLVSIREKSALTIEGRKQVQVR